MSARQQLTPPQTRSAAASAVDCAGRHGLLSHTTTEGGYTCDHCGADDLPVGTNLWGCKLCQYDVCESCHTRGANAAGAFAAVADAAAQAEPLSQRELVVEKLRDFLSAVPIGGREGKGTFEGNYSAIVEFALCSGDAMCARSAEDILAAYTEDKVAKAAQPFGPTDLDQHSAASHDPEDVAARAEVAKLQARLIAEQNLTTCTRSAARVFSTGGQTQAAPTVDTAPATHRSKGTTGRPKLVAVNCEGGHGLTCKATDLAGYNCDACGKEDLPAGTSLWGCRICDYDVCEDCWRQGRDIPRLVPRSRPELEPEPEPEPELVPQTETTEQTFAQLKPEPPESRSHPEPATPHEASVKSGAETRRQQWIAWDVDEVCEWLGGIGGLSSSSKEACSTAFRTHRVSGAALALLDVTSEGSRGMHTLKTELGITALGDQLILCSEIQALRSETKALEKPSYRGSYFSPGDDPYTRLSRSDRTHSAGSGSPWSEEAFPVAESSTFPVELTGESQLGVRWMRRDSAAEYGPLEVAEVFRGGGFAETLPNHEIRYAWATCNQQSRSLDFGRS